MVSLELIAGGAFVYGEGVLKTGFILIFLLSTFGDKEA
jgi:hypothetical protein